MSTAQGYLKRIEHSDDQPVECGNGRLLIGRMRAKVGNEQREDDLYSVTLRNGRNMIAWGTAKKACELAQYLDHEDTLVTLRFPTLSLGKKLQDAIVQTAEDYLSQTADPEALRGPKRVKHEHLDEVLPSNPYPERAFARDSLYKHDSPNDDSKSNPDPVPDETINGGAAQEVTKHPEDQRHAQGEASQNNEHLEEKQAAQPEDRELNCAEMFEYPDDCWPKDIMAFPWKDVNVEFMRWWLPRSLLPVRRPHVVVADDTIKVTGVSYSKSAIWDQRVLEELMAQPEIMIEIDSKVNSLQQAQQPLHELHTVPPCLPAQILSLVKISKKYDQSKRKIVVWLKIGMYSPPWYPRNVSEQHQTALDGRGSQFSPAWENFSISDTEKLARSLMRRFMILRNVEGIFRVDVRTRSGTIKFNGSAVWVLWKQNWE